MRAGLVGYFDIGASYGLGDEAFPDDAAPEPDADLVGINFPLGNGLILDLPGPAPELVELWRAGANQQVERLNRAREWSADLGVPEEWFERELRDLVANTRISRCRLTIYAIGTVYTELRFADVAPVSHIGHLLSCFEFAAYTPGIADRLEEIARERIESVTDSANAGLVELTKRELPQPRPDANGYVERALFSSFTQVIACVDEGDDRHLAEVLQVFDLEEEDVIEFSFCGKLHDGYAACVLEPNPVRSAQRPGARVYSRDEQLMRIEACIQVAHVFVGTCEALRGFLLGEIHEQVRGFAGDRIDVRPPEELNRMRAVALAVVNLTDFQWVTPSAEDRLYFERFSEQSDLESTQSSIQHATEVLYNVQVAEVQLDESKRQRTLNIIALILASLTLMSVSALAYDFIRADESLVGNQAGRIWLLVGFTIGVIVIATALIFATRPRRRRRASRGGPN